MNKHIPTPLGDFLDQALAAIPANAGRRIEMREELLAHLLAVFDEECARWHDESAAVTATLRRFGAADDLKQELADAVPTTARVWHHLFRKEPLMRWVFLFLGVVGFFVGAGFICPAVAELLVQTGVMEREGLHHYSGGFMIGLSITLLLFGCALTLGGVWSVVHGVKRFRMRSS